MNNIYLIFGASGSGKTAITNLLEKKYGLTSVQSYTTRTPRTPEETGHTFVTNDEFNNLTDIVGYAESYGNRYGATLEQINNCDIYVINPVGIKYFREHYFGSKGYKTIFIKSPLVLRMERMEKRDGFDTALSRIKNDIIEFKDSELLADEIFFNDEDTDIEELTQSVYDYIIDCEIEK